MHPINTQLFCVTFKLLGNLPSDQRDAVDKIVPQLHDPQHAVHREVDRALVQQAAEAVSDYSFSVSDAAEREAVETTLHALVWWLTTVAPPPVEDDEKEADNA